MSRINLWRGSKSLSEEKEDPKEGTNTTQEKSNFSLSTVSFEPR